MTYFDAPLSLRPSFVHHRHRVDRILRQIGAEPDRGDEGALEIVRTVEAGLGGEGPAVHLAAGVLVLALDPLHRRTRRLLDGCLDLRALGAQPERTARRDSQRRQLGDHHPIPKEGRIAPISIASRSK